jgi:subtilase family serine protease
MKKPRSVIAATALAATTITAVAVGSTAQASASGLPAGPVSQVGQATEGVTTLADSVAPFTAVNRMTGAVPAASELTIQFWLAPQAAAAESFANAVSTPGSPQFGQFLSPAAYTTRFGATPAEVTGVESWLRSAGFTGMTTDPGLDYVRATAPAATIDSALKLQLQYYAATAGANAGNFPLRANDRPVSLPAAVAASVVGVTGLENAGPTMTYATPVNPAAAEQGKPAATGPSFACSQWYAQHYATGLPAMFGVKKFPSIICGYTPQQLRKAYGYSSANVGKGVTVAYVEDGLVPSMFQTLEIYARVHGIQAPSPARYSELSLGQGSACGDPFNIEEQLDVESSYDMAPLQHQLVVGGDSCNNGDFGLQALFNADETVLDGADGHPLARIASNSWEGGDETIPANDLLIEHDYLIKAAAEGVTMLFSAGDYSGVGTPSSDPYATAVGGTTLAIGHDNQRIFETGWSTGISEDTNGGWAFQGEQGAGGGGASLLWKQPSYQQGVVPDSMAETTGDRGGLVRTVPDLSADADPFTGMTVGMLSNGATKGGSNGEDAAAQGDVAGVQANASGYFEQTIGGTSLAAPLVAGILADTEQGSRALGFINPALYQLARQQPAVFHDAKPLVASSPASYRGVACDAAMCGVLSLTASDDQSWDMAGYTGQVTAPGYDTITGIGTPNGQEFIDALRGL